MRLKGSKFEDNQNILSTPEIIKKKLDEFIENFLCI